MNLDISKCKKCGSKNIELNKFINCYMISCDYCGYYKDGIDKIEVLKKWNEGDADE